MLIIYFYTLESINFLEIIYPTLDSGALGGGAGGSGWVRNSVLDQGASRTGYSDETTDITVIPWALFWMYVSLERHYWSTTQCISAQERIQLSEQRRTRRFGEGPEGLEVLEVQRRHHPRKHGGSHGARHRARTVRGTRTGPWRSGTESR